MANYRILGGINYQKKDGFTVAMGVDAIRESGDRSEDFQFFQDGDILEIGQLPKETLVDEAYFWITEKFSAGATLDYGHGVYNGDGQLIDINVIDTVPLDSWNTMRLKLFTTLYDSDGTDTGETVLRLTNGTLDVVARFNIPTPLTAGQCAFVFECSAVVANTGEYVT